MLIFGETGTGSEMVARCLRDLAHPGQENYVALNCGGMSDNLLDSELFGLEPGAFTGAQKRRIGKIEYASGGTLFPRRSRIDADEHADQAAARCCRSGSSKRLGLQPARSVSCRVVAASKEDLKLLSDQGQFRADLYYRLNVVRIELRRCANGEDILPLRRILPQAAKRATIGRRR